WLKQDFAGVLRALDERRNELPPNFIWKYQDYRVRALVKLKRADEALREAEAVCKKKTGSRVLLALAHAARGDVQGTIAAVSGDGRFSFLVETCYRDEDLGPMLRADAFRAFRDRFPEPREGEARFDFDPFDD